LKRNRIRKRRSERRVTGSCRFRTFIVTVLMAVSFAVQSAGSGTFMYAEAVYAAGQTAADEEPEGSPADDAGTGGSEAGKEEAPDEDADEGAGRDGTVTGGTSDMPGESTGGPSSGTGETDAGAAGTDAAAAETGQVSEAEKPDDTGGRTQSGQEENPETAPEVPADQNTPRDQDPGDRQDRDADRNSGKGDTAADSLIAVPGSGENDAKDAGQEGPGQGQSAGRDNTAEAVTAGEAGTQVEPAQQTETAQQTDLPPEEWLTVQENRLAFRSATRGSSSGLSQAVVVSKGPGINYIKLGLGIEMEGHVDHTTLITVGDENSNRYVGVCVVPDDLSWGKGAVLPDVKRVTDATLIRLYYYTMLNDFGTELAQSRGFGDIAEKAAIAACHEAMSMRYSDLAGVDYDRPNVSSDLRNLARAYQNAVASKPLPDPDRVFIYICARKRYEGHWRQPYIFGRIADDDTASVVLVKTSADADMQSGLSAYCLHQTASGGPVNFRLYTDAACTHPADAWADLERKEKLDPIPVGLNSKNGLNNRTEFYCDPGTYYLKELTTPKGYQEAAKPFGPYTLEEGKGLTMRISNTPVYARAGIYKLDSKTKEPVAGAKFGLYSEREDAQNKETPEAVLTTGEDGRSNTANVLAGRTYYVREIEAPFDYKEDMSLHQLAVADSFSQVKWTEISNVPREGKIRVIKTSSDPEADYSPYSLAGAVYTVYNKSGRAVGTVKTGADGTSAELTVRIGKYTVRETSPSPGFKLDPRTYEAEVQENTLTTVQSVEEPRKGKIVVRKYSSMEKEKKEPDTMPIAGAVYTLYKSEEDARDNRAAAGTFVIKEDGSSNVVEMLVGRKYYIKETKTPEGYLPDEEIHVVDVREFEATVKAESEDRLIFGGVEAAKLDLETAKGTPLGGAALEGAVFRIYNDGERSVYAGDRKVLPGAEAMTLQTDAEGRIKTADHALSYGDYRIEETTPPEGYTMRGAEPVRFRIREDGAIVDLTGRTETCICNAVKRGDIALRKLNGYTQRRMAGVTFEITGFDHEGNEIEKHRFTTDRNGNFESTAAWQAAQTLQSGIPAGLLSDQEKNATDAAAGGLPGDGTPGNSQPGSSGDGTPGNSQPGSPEDAAASGRDQADTGRLWFGIGTEPDDALRALPYGEYHIEEIEGDNNRGMKMFSEDIFVYADRMTIDLGNVENTQKPVLETELVDENGGHFTGCDGMVTLTDTVTYGGMEDYIGQEVTFRGVIYVKETGRPLEVGGKPVETVRVKKILSPAGTVELRFTFDASGVKGKTLVCYEYAYEGDVAESVTYSEVPGDGTPADEEPDEENPPDGPQDDKPGDPQDQPKEIASHTDLNDEAQSMHLVSIETEADDAKTGMHIGMAADGAVTVDHVTCDGLIPKAEYRVTGVLVDKKTGRPLLDRKGKEVRAEASFRAKAVKETVDLTFRYDASLLDGTTVVAFERLYFKGELPPGAPDPDTPVAVHEDPDDEDQSVHYPQIRTTATAADGTSKTVQTGSRCTVIDHVIWKNLIPGRGYRLQGALVYKEDGKPVKAGGKAVTAHTDLIPAAADGETDLTFTFDASGMSGDHGAVAFEDLYLLPGGQDEEKETGDSGTGSPSDSALGGQDGDKKDDKEKSPVTIPADGLLIASHRDLTDADQTVLLRQPEEPEGPAEPGKPSEPEKTEKDSTSLRTGTGSSGRRKVTPASPDTVSVSSAAPRTGDETDIRLYLLPALAAAAGAAGILLWKKKKGKNQEL